MTARKAAGWVLVSLLPDALIVFAVLNGKLVELVIGLTVAAVGAASMWLGIEWISDREPSSDRESR